MSGPLQPFPNITLPLTEVRGAKAGGFITQPWLNLLRTLWLRTGGTFGPVSGQPGVIALTGGGDDEGGGDTYYLLGPPNAGGGGGGGSPSLAVIMGMNGEDGQDAIPIPSPSVSSPFTLLGLVSTTNATPATIATVAVSANSALTINGMVTARRTGGTGGTTGDSAGYVLSAIVKNIAGTVTVVGQALTFSGADQGAWTVTVSGSGSNMLIQVTGAANNNIDWTLAAAQLGVS